MSTEKKRDDSPGTKKSMLSGAIQNVRNNSPGRSSAFDRAPEGSVAVEIDPKGTVQNDADAKKAVEEYNKKNADFAKSHSYLGQWKDTGNNGDKIVAYFKQTAPSSRHGSVKGGSVRGSSLKKERDGENAEPGSGHFGPVSGFARDYRVHHDPGFVRMERDLSHNAMLQQRRRDLSYDMPPPDSHRFRMHEIGVPVDRTFDHRGAGRLGRSSPLRSNSPTGHRRLEFRNSPVRVEHRTVHVAPPVPYQPAFSHYEQHRAQREERDHNEYIKIQREHEELHAVNARSSDLRGALIQTYRNEIEAHKLNERNFATLRAQIEDLFRRREAYETSVSILKSDFEAQLASQGGVISSLENELNCLRAQNDDRAKESVEASEQCQAVRAEISSVEVTMREVEGGIANVITMNQSIERDIDMARQGINEQQEIRSRQQATIYQNNGALSKWEQECFAQQARISVLEKERATLIDRTAALDEQLKMRCSQGDDCQTRIVAAQTDISKLKSTIHGLDLEINNLEKSNNMLVDEQKHKLAKNSAEYNMAHELTTQLQGLEAKFYGLEVEERSKNTDLEAVNYSNQALMDRNLDLKAEYEALQKHSTLLAQQNKDLQRELDQFVETDAVVRRNLDRKEKVGLIREKVDVAIHQSSALIAKSRSPMREYSPARVIHENFRPGHHMGPPPVHHPSAAFLASPHGPPMATVTNTVHHRDYSPAH